jgi:protein disulfide-isomerase
MKRLIISAVLLATTTVLVAADTDSEETANWQTDYKTALKLAAYEKKPVLMDFTGSDWCRWCIKLDEEIFSKPKFQQFASEHLILLKVDFPENIPQSDKLKKQNNNLDTKFQVEGYPTLILIDSNGKEIERTRGYISGGPKALIDWVNEAVK